LRHRPQQPSRRLLLSIAVAAAFFALPVSAEEEAPAAAAEEVEEVEAVPAEHHLVVEARQTREDLDETLKRARELLRKIERLPESERAGLEEQRFRVELAYHQKIVGLTQNVQQQEEAGLEPTEARADLVARWKSSIPGYARVLDWRQARAARARKLAEQAPWEDRIRAEQAVTDQEERLDALLRATLEAEEEAEGLGIELAVQQREATHARIVARGEDMASRLRIATQYRQTSALLVGTNPEEPKAKAELELAQLLVQREAEGLTTAVFLLRQLGEPTAAHQQLLIESTGELTTGIFDREVLGGLLKAWREQVTDRIERKGPVWVIRALLFVLIVGVFALIGALVGRVVRASVTSPRFGFSQLLQRTLISSSARIFVLIGLLIALGQVGVDVGTLLAGVGIAGLVIGFALQDSLANFASGFMILFYRPFDVGDFIEAAGVQGVVRQMTFASTTVHTYDNQTLIVPNRRVWGDAIRNVTEKTTRRVDLSFPIAFDEDVERVDALMREILASQVSVLDDPPPVVEVHSVKESHLELAVRPWVKTEDYWTTRWNVNREVVTRLRREGIRLQAPRRDVRIQPEDT
jgi:small conductance mechanosensitive channel